MVRQRTVCSSFRAKADSYFIQMAKQIGWILIYAIGSGSLQFLLSISA
jgi:hypothetical protein